MATDKISIDVLSTNERVTVCIALDMLVASLSRAAKSAKTDGLRSEYEKGCNEARNLIAKFRV